jgi:hypothetical protein
VVTHHVQHGPVRPAGLGLEQAQLVVVGQQQIGSADQLGDVVALHPGQLLGRVGGEPVPPLATLLGVPDHRRRVVRGDHHQVQPAVGGGDRTQFDLPCAGHRAGVEGRDLVHILVGGADEPGRLHVLAPVDLGAVHAVPGQPGVVVAEVGAGRADQDRVEPQGRHPEADVGRHPAAAHHQVVDQERQRHPVQLIGQQRLGEPAREMHQVVGGDGSADGDRHGKHSRAS